MNRRPMRDSKILIRACNGLEELGACVRLQREVWGLEEIDVVPRRSFVVAEHIGGQVIGAFDTSLPGAGTTGNAESLAGFAMALPGFLHAPADGAAAAPGQARAVQPYFHSHMLAVANQYRNRGIGRRLKLAQRDDALRRGIERMEWTFDPLEIKNAYLNIHRLGVVVRRYSPDMYGVSSSRLQGKLPTDRLCAEWWMGSRRVRRAIEGKPLVSHTVETRIAVPGQVGAWRANPEERERALEVQKENRRLFGEAFAQGLAVFGFLVDARGDGVFQLGRMERLAEELSKPESGENSSNENQSSGRP